MEYEELLTLDDAAKVLNVSVRTLFRIRQTGALYHTMAGKRVRYTLEQLHDYVRRNIVKPGVKASAAKPNKPKDPEQSRAERELREAHGITF